ncbi:MAG: DinB family protein [Planctomycetota bacterium]|jgi:hypothetical protein
MSSPLLDTGLFAMNFSRKFTMSYLDAIPEDQWTHMPLPGGNHALWIAGHVAWEDEDMLGNLVTGRRNKLPQSWHEACGQGSTPIPDRNAYPSIEEARNRMAELRQELVDFFSSKSEGQRLEPLTDPQLKFAGNLAGLMVYIGSHECMHAGQLTAIRKSLKLEPVFG